MTEPVQDLNDAHKRHWLFGFNLALLVVVALMILVMLMIAVERTKASTQWDISSNSVNSLSGSSKKLLQDISAKKQNFHIVSLFTDPSNEEKTKGDPNNQAEKRRQVMDLLNLYHKNSSYVQVDDWGDRARDDIEKEIREKYAKDLKPYEDAVKDFDPLAQELRTFANDEAEQIAAAVQKAGAKPDDMETAAQLQSTFHALPSALDDLQRDIHRQSDSTLPEWNEITRSIKEKIDSFEAFMAIFSDLDKLKNIDAAKSLLPYFTEANPRYKKVEASVKAYLDKLTKLQTLKVQDILSGVGRNTIVVLGPDSAKVLSRWDIFDASAPSDPTAQPVTTFKGEEVISSALLAMARPEKVKVVFVTGSPQHITTDLYSSMTKVLEEANFEVLDWSPPGAPGPDAPPTADPPAQGKGVVWVVFPPDAPNQQQMMMMMTPPDPKPVIDATRKHMAQGGQVLFMAESSGANPMGGGADKYAYDDLLQPFGIQVKPKYTAVDLTDGVSQTTGERVQRYMPYIEITHFEDHEITTPIQSFPTAFFPAQALTVVDIAKPAPADAEPKVIIRTPNAPEYWAESDFAAKPNFDPQTDLASPVPLAAVSIRNKGKSDEQRVMVVGTKYIAANPIFSATELAQIGSQIVEVPRFPGNAELMRNSILWLAGYENMIAVSSKANAGSRLTVSTSGLNMLRATVAVIVPALVLLMGVMVWMVRHR